MESHFLVLIIIVLIAWKILKYLRRIPPTEYYDKIISEGLVGKLSTSEFDKCGDRRVSVYGATSFDQKEAAVTSSSPVSTETMIIKILSILIGIVHAGSVSSQSLISPSPSISSIPTTFASRSSLTIFPDNTNNTTCITTTDLPTVSRCFSDATIALRAAIEVRNLQLPHVHFGKHVIIRTGEYNLNTLQGDPFDIYDTLTLDFEIGSRLLLPHGFKGTVFRIQDYRSNRISIPTNPAIPHQMKNIVIKGATIFEKQPPANSSRSANWTAFEIRSCAAKGISRVSLLSNRIIWAGIAFDFHVSVDKKCGATGDKSWINQNEFIENDIENTRVGFRFKYDRSCSGGKCGLNANNFYRNSFHGSERPKTCIAFKNILGKYNTFSGNVVYDVARQGFCNNNTSNISNKDNRSMLISNQAIGTTVMGGMLSLKVSHLFEDQGRCTGVFAEGVLRQSPASHNCPK